MIAGSLLVEREVKALRWSIIARLVFLSIVPILLMFMRIDRPEVRAMIPMVASGLVLSLLALWRLRKPNPNFRLLAFITLSHDVIMLTMSPLLWYFVVGEGRVGTAFLLKSELTTLSFVLIIINTMTLQPLFPALVTFKVIVLHIVILVIVSLDPRTKFTSDIFASLASSEVHIAIYLNRILILLFIGVALTLLARAARRTLRDVVELERKNARIEEEQAHRIMQAKMESLTGLVAGIAHEMNSPLGVVSSSASTAVACADRIARNDRPEKAVELLVPAARTIADASGRLQELVTSLKNFARLDQSEIADVVLVSCVEDALALIPDRELTGVELIRDFVDVPLFRGKPQELNQVFYTLIENAVEAMHGRTGSKLKLIIRRTESAIVIVVEDNGIGIAPERIPRLFDLIFREKGGRMGIGLALPAAQAIVTRHGGHIEVESKLGVGTKVTVELPSARS